MIHFNVPHQFTIFFLQFTDIVAFCPVEVELLQIVCSVQTASSNGRLLSSKYWTLSQPRRGQYSENVNTSLRLPKQLLHRGGQSHRLRSSAYRNPDYGICAKFEFRQFPEVVATRNANFYIASCSVCVRMHLLNDLSIAISNITIYA